MKISERERLYLFLNNETNKTLICMCIGLILGLFFTLFIHNAILNVLICVVIYFIAYKILEYKVENLREEIGHEDEERTIGKFDDEDF